MSVPDAIMDELDIETKEQLVALGKRPRHNSDPLPRFAISESDNVNPLLVIKPENIEYQVDTCISKKIEPLLAHVREQMHCLNQQQEATMSTANDIVRQMAESMTQFHSDQRMLFQQMQHDRIAFQKTRTGTC